MQDLSPSPRLDFLPPQPHRTLWRTPSAVLSRMQGALTRYPKVVRPEPPTGPLWTRTKRRAVVVCTMWCCAVTGCAERDESPAVARGRQAYMGTCIACHNMNPALDGAVGPAVKGASKELLTAKVLRGEYPPGYKAKRDTRMMPPQPNMAASIDDIAAFLASP